MRVIIAGGRNFNDDKFIYHKLDEFFKDKDTSKIEEINGCARGVDLIGACYCREHGMKVKAFPADWTRLGKKAGIIRNQQMADYAKEDNGVLIAFWNGKSRGTKNMIDTAKKEGLEVNIIKYEDNN